MAGRVLSIAIGIALLAAAALKAEALIGASVSPDRALDALWFPLGALVAEVFLGIWLVSGVFPSFGRRVALAGFLLFSCVAAYKVVTGAASCGCLGRVEVQGQRILNY